ncbi:Transmembrane glycoprotein NMB [Fukomys damarensis]|uniref:Mitochondrial assembly of ribosomal large subunit protein 1 n=1 Tax=Fukomys damarensis TaxID=885580 RepID=A0A091D1V7_FUKDA|nr:Transmembrane glycoprotein NMB [Fukomys damarensis]
MESLHWILGFLLLATRLPLDSAKRFYDVLGNERHRGYMREHNQLHGWSSDENDWDEKLYPVWKRGDARWKSSWKGGQVQAILTSNSPALVGSDITFAVNLAFPRCQKEDANGNIVYEKNCRNGQYFQKLGRCSVRISMNTANLTLGPQVMEVTVYRRHGWAYIPIAQVRDVYVVTDHIPVFVTMSQKNDRNVSDETFLRDLPIIFDALIHDPSHFLNESSIYFKWNFGDNTGLFVSSNHTLNHTYVLNGTFNLNLTVQGSVPGPCPSPSTLPKPIPSSVTIFKTSYYPNTPVPAGDNPLELSKIADENCQINRYGYFKATLTIVDHTGPKFDIDLLVSLLRQENARDICVIKVPPEMRYTDYFVIGSGTSTRHLHAMAYYIVKMYKYLKCKSEPHVRIEGKDTDDWLCVDFGNMVIHLMLPESRETYELEKLWTLRSYDDQLSQIPPETLPEDFILGIEEEDTSLLTPVEFKCE